MVWVSLERAQDLFGICELVFSPPTHSILPLKPMLEDDLLGAPRYRQGGYLLQAETDAKIDEYLQLLQELCQRFNFTLTQQDDLLTSSPPWRVHSPNHPLASVTLRQLIAAQAYVMMAQMHGEDILETWAFLSTDKRTRMARMVL